MSSPIAALVTSAAPVTFVSNVRRHVAASVSASRANGPIPGAYTRASIPPSPAAASAIADRHDVSSVTSHSIASVEGPASFAASSRLFASPREQRDVRAPLGEADSDAAPEPARRAYDHGSQRSPL